MPARTRPSWVSLKFARTHTSCSGTMARSGCPTCTICPSSTLLREINPSIGARTSVYESCRSASARSALLWVRVASARVISASFTVT